MKKVTQIIQRLNNAEEQLKELTAWHEKAYAKYLEETKVWGLEADRAEIDYISDLSSDCHKEINILKWVLDTSKEPIVKLNTDEGDE